MSVYPFNHNISSSNETYQREEKNGIQSITAPRYCVVDEGDHTFSKEIIYNFFMKRIFHLTDSGGTSYISTVLKCNTLIA